MQQTFTRGRATTHLRDRAGECGTLGRVDDAARNALLESLARHVAADVREAEDTLRVADFVRRHADPFDRRIAEGHLTGSAMVVAADGSGVLLLFHRKLQRWLQPGGHADPGESSGGAVALREALEETGLAGLALHASAPQPLDVDVHVIPARGAEPQHLHLDLRYLVAADRRAAIAHAEAESQALRWFDWDELARLDLDPGIQRALRKARAILG